MQTLRHTPPLAASPLRQVAIGPSSLPHDHTTEAVGKSTTGSDDVRVRHHLIRAAVWAPTAGEKDACVDAFTENQKWEECAQVRWPDPLDWFYRMEPSALGYADTFAHHFASKLSSPSEDEVGSMWDFTGE